MCALKFEAQVVIMSKVVDKTGDQPVDNKRVETLEHSLDELLNT